MKPFVGHISVCGELCCEDCNEIIHNHLDCPVCGKEYAASKNYHDLSADTPHRLECECGAIFETTDFPYDEEATWRQVSNGAVDRSPGASVARSPRAAPSSWRWLMILARAKRYSEKIAAELSPFCERIEIAGSIRRKRPEVNDIDLVMIARDPDGRENIIRRCSELCACILSGKVNLSFENPAGLRIDLYLAHPRSEDMFHFLTASNWGALLLCRTGSKDFNAWLADQAKALNFQYKPYVGVVNNSGDLIAGETEEEIFRALGLGWIAPEKRER